MKEAFTYELEPKKIYLRPRLAEQMGITDRQMREKIRQMRRAGIPVVALQKGGYKLAETEAEKRQLLHMYRSRAMDELGTYAALAKTLKIEGQLSIEDIVGLVEEIQR